MEALGVLTGAQQRFDEKHPWGLQVPLICADGAIVAYSWKRQIAGQAAASAVERTRSSSFLDLNCFHFGYLYQHLNM